MLGKLPDGTRLAGGPYTSVQALAFGATLTLLWLSMPIWNQMGLGLGNVVVLLGLPFLATMAARKVRLGGRSPRSVALGVLSGYLQPATGRLQGRTVPRLRTSRVRGPSGAWGAPTGSPASGRGAGRRARHCCGATAGDFRPAGRRQPRREPTAAAEPES